MGFRQPLIGSRATTYMGWVCVGKSSIKDFSAIPLHPQLSLETSQVAKSLQQPAIPCQEKNIAQNKAKVMELRKTQTFHQIGAKSETEDCPTD